MLLDVTVTDSLWDRLVKYWHKSGLQIRAGVNAREISAFESKYGVVLLPSIRQYFETVDGTGDDMEGAFAIRFGP